MAAIDEQDLDAKIVAAFRADATLQSLLGATPNTRVYTRLPRTAITYPFVKIDSVASVPPTGCMTGAGINWVETFGRTFKAYSQKTSLAEVQDIRKAICTLIDKAPTNIVLTTGAIFNVLPGARWTYYDPDSGTSMAIMDYTLWVSN